MHYGKLALPNIGEDTILNYDRATVVEKRDRGTEQEFEIKIPRGNSLSFKKVRLVLLQQEDGWRISSEIGSF